MANLDRPAGFTPYGCTIRKRVYAVNTAPTINLSVGDMVEPGGAQVLTPKGYKMDVVDGAVISGSSAQLLGPILGCQSETGDTLKYIAAGRVGNSTIAGYITVADHPDQLFIGQEDAGGNAIDLAEGGMNVDIIPGTLNAVDSVTELSTQELDSDTAATTDTLHMRIIEPHPDDIPADDSDVGCRYICQINTHFYGSHTTAI